MSKQVQILLSRPLTVNLGTDEHGQPKSVKLPAGLQQVESEVAENWFVKAHCQEISSNDIQTGELQKQLDEANEALKALQTQSDEATKKIGQLEGDLKERDTEIANLKIQLDKALQTQAAEVKAKEPAKAKDAPKET
ncbi:STY1053 family phage-associated protein [Acinetobacter seifertii]|uniref:STY1053 family phage-associated protein n=1 Tax=Acinetobacter seifertii TaxID=1530123 RepID=UPI0032B31283